jgi:hypothetical protein
MGETPTIKSVLAFMQRNDRNGDWLGWLSEIERGESEFDKGVVLASLESWYDNSSDEIYASMIKTVNSL